MFTARYNNDRGGGILTTRVRILRGFLMPPTTTTSSRRTYRLSPAEKLRRRNSAKGGEADLLTDATARKTREREKQERQRPQYNYSELS